MDPLQSFLLAAMALLALTHLPMSTAPPVYTMPYETAIPIGLCDNGVWRIRGVVPKDAARFYINFKRGDDIAFHFNPRLDKSVVVFNSLISGAWQTEEKLGSPAFQRGEPFELMISAEKDKYKVVVGG
eukprot:UN11677